MNTVVSSMWLPQLASKRFNWDNLMKISLDLIEMFSFDSSITLTGSSNVLELLETIENWIGSEGDFPEFSFTQYLHPQPSSWLLLPRYQSQIPTSHLQLCSNIIVKNFSSDCIFHFKFIMTSIFVKTHIDLPIYIPFLRLGFCNWRDVCQPTFYLHNSFLVKSSSTL